MAKITQYSRISHHTLFGDAYTNATFSVPAQEDFTVYGLSSSWSEYDLALSEIGVNEQDNTAYLRIGQNINQFLFVGMTGGGGGGGTYSGSSGSSGSSGTSGTSGIKGATGATGPAGGNGFNGTSGTSGLSVYGSNAANTVDYTYNPNVVAYIDPGATYFATNNLRMSDVTKFSISHINLYGNDFTTWFDYLASSVSQGLYLTVVQKNDASQIAFYKVTSVTTHTSYVDLSVTNLYGSLSFHSADFSLAFAIGGGANATEYTPAGQGDTYGIIGQITYDDNWLYIKNKIGWFKTKIDPA
jgi:hypothetical protein